MEKLPRNHPLVRDYAQLRNAYQGLEEQLADSEARLANMTRAFTSLVELIRARNPEVKLCLAV